MADLVGIANRALSRVGDSRIVSMTAPSKQARAVNDAWEIVRDEVFRAHPWNCISARAQLAALSPVPVFGYEQHYQLPSDCLRVLELVEPFARFTWIIEGRALLTDAGAPIDIRYIVDEENTAVYDPMLVGALVARLAAEISEELTQSNSKTELRWKEYKESLRLAKGVDGQEQSPMPFEEDDWVNARF